MRCRGCNGILTPLEMVALAPDGEQEDLCVRCLVAAEVCCDEEEFEEEEDVSDIY